MFSRFCKNSIFPAAQPPSTTTSSSADIVIPNSSSYLNINSRQLPSLPPRRPSSQQPQLGREPPPPYWAHYNHHPVLDPNDSTSDESENNEETATHHRYNIQSRNRQRFKEYLLSEDAFCPDLVRNCKTTEQEASDSNDQDYVEIEELNQNVSRIDLNAVEPTPDRGGTSNCDMGQNLSIRRPKISLTWVLREQQNVQQTPQIKPVPINNQQPPQRTKSRSRSKERLFSEKYVSDNNLSEYHSEKCKNNNVTSNNNNNNNNNRKSIRSYRKNNEKSKKIERSSCVPPANKCDLLLNNNSIVTNLNNDDLIKEKIISLKNTYSEPSLYTTVSEPSSSKKNRHRRRRERYRSQRFGYEIQNVDEFLSKCSLASPGNIPVVLSSSSTLYQTRPGGYQIEIPLPLGMVVNSVFKNESWLYVQTPHAEEGYVAYDTCLPLGILPPNQRSSSASRPTPCWESNKDVFPRPCGNMTDSEKEIQQLKGTRSEGRRTPRLKRNNKSLVTCNNSEKNLDVLYLRAASQSKADTQMQFAQLKLTNKVLNTNNCSKILNVDKFEKPNGDYVQLKQHQHHHQKIVKGQKTVNSSNNLVNSHIRASSVRQTLLAITDNYCSESVDVHKGDVVTLLACKEYQETGVKNHKQWFFIRTRDGQEGYIPAEAAGHGFL